MYKNEPILHKEASGGDGIRTHEPLKERISQQERDFSDLEFRQSSLEVEGYRRV